VREKGGSMKSKKEGKRKEREKETGEFERDKKKLRTQETKRSWQIREKNGI
jgi:hypothetical protein